MVVNWTDERNDACSYITQLPFMLHLIQESSSTAYTDQTEAKFRAMMWEIVDQVNNHPDICHRPSPIRQYHLELWLWRRYYSTPFPGIYPVEITPTAPPPYFENGTKVEMNPASEFGPVEPVDSSYYSNMNPCHGQEHNDNSKPVSIMKRENNSTLTEHGSQNGRRKTVTFEARLSRIPVLDPVALPMAQPRQRYVPSFEHQSGQEMVKTAANTPPAFYDGTGNSMHNQPGHAQSAEYSFNEHNRHKIWKALLPHRPPEHGFDPATGCPYYAAFCFALNGFNEFCGVDKAYYDQIARVPAFKCFRIRFQKIEISVLMVWPECAHPAITSILHTNPEEWARFKMLYAFLKTWCNLANADESGGQALNIVRHLELNRQLWEAYDTSDLVRPPLDERVMAARNGVTGGSSGNRQGGAKLIQSSTYYAGWQ